MIRRLAWALVKLLAAAMILAVLAYVGYRYAVHAGLIESASSLGGIGPLIGKGLGLLAVGWFIMEIVFGGDDGQQPPSGQTKQ